jgi:predicted hydrocarbon binding protein
LRAGKLENGLRGFNLDEKGILTAFGDRFLIMPAKFMHSIEDLLIKTFGPIAAANLLYEMGREAGKYSVELASTAGYDLTQVQDQQRLGKELISQWGWGRTGTVQLGPERKLARTQRTNSIFVRTRRGKTPVCHFLRGLDASILQVAFGKRCESIEVSCEGKGNTSCEIVTGNPAQVARFAETLDMSQKAHAL